MRRHHLILFATLLFLMVGLTASPQPAQGADFTPPWFIDTELTDNLNTPTAMTFAPDGRLFILEKGGTMRIFENGQLLPAPFLTLNVSSDGEQGLLGLAFDPDFETNNYLYVYYTTAETPRRNRISRFTANGNTVVPNSELVLLNLDDIVPGNDTHNGGTLVFRDDGKLYAGIGDGEDDPNDSQSLDSFWGTIVRINTDGSIPTDNPFYDTATGDLRAIWVLGLRNPFVIDNDPVTNRLFINDVGQNSFEEVNEGLAGSNYGWPITEGFSEQGDPLPQNYVEPLYVYPHQNGDCSITGGEFYRPQTAQFPSFYVGDYFFVDFCSARMWRYDTDTDTVTVFAERLTGGPVDIETAPDGTLYYLDVRGSLNQISFVGYDLNEDGFVTASDAVYVVNNIGSDDALADVDQDGTVTEADANAVLAQIGTTIDN